MMRLFFVLVFALSGQAIFAQLSSVEIARRVDNSVVVIETYDARRQPIAQGSGVVVSADGKIITNYHVIEDGKYIVVKHGDKKYYSQEILYSDPERDMAIFTIGSSDLQPLKLGNSDLLEKGEVVYALGSPQGLENTITSGIVSALRYKLYAMNSYQNYIQHDAAISQGSSGGALVNNKGELVGINVFIFKDGQNLGFAIPVNDVADKINGNKSNHYTANKPTTAAPKTTTQPRVNTQPKTAPKTYGSTKPKTKPAPRIEYAAGYGCISIFSTSAEAATDVYINKKFLGTTEMYFTAAPECRQEGTLSVLVKAGTNKIYAEDAYGNTWQNEVKVPDGECVLIGLKSEGYSAR